MVASIFLAEIARYDVVHKARKLKKKSFLAEKCQFDAGIVTFGNAESLIFEERTAITVSHRGDVV